MRYRLSQNGASAMLPPDPEPKHYSSAPLADESDAADDIAQVRRRLADLDAERARLTRQLETLERSQAARSPPPAPTAPIAAPVDNRSSSAEKIALFRRLFAGRPDVYPVRWENRKTGSSGYAPACANEWAKGICGKPKVKCGECPHQAFLPFTEAVAARHLRGDDGRAGDFIAGVYPLLRDGLSAARSGNPAPRSETRDSVDQPKGAHATNRVTRHACEHGCARLDFRKEQPHRRAQGEDQRNEQQLPDLDTHVERQ